MVDICVGENCSCNRRLSNAVVRMKFWSSFDLPAQIRRRSEQEPGLVASLNVSTDGHLRLTARFAVKCSNAHRTAIRARAIPLGKSSSGGGAENLHAHA